MFINSATCRTCPEFKRDVIKERLDGKLLFVKHTYSKMFSKVNWIQVAIWVEFLSFPPMHPRREKSLIFSPVMVDLFCSYRPLIKNRNGSASNYRLSNWHKPPQCCFVLELHRLMAIIRRNHYSKYIREGSHKEKDKMLNGITDALRARL